LIALITLSEVGQQISMLIKNVSLQVLEVLSPVLTTIAVIMIVFGVLALSAGREWLGLRLIVGGGILLIAVHLVVPMLLQFI
jgi:membrane-bound ClpP family serine protease